MTIWNWDNMHNRAEYPEPETLVFGLPEVHEGGRVLALCASSSQLGYDSEARAEELL